jgi:hypothetical protein
MTKVFCLAKPLDIVTVALIALATLGDVTQIETILGVVSPKVSKTSKGSVTAVGSI